MVDIQKQIEFGRFRLDLTNECLWQGARAISLRPKAFAVLRLLVDHPGQLVNKQQVLDAVWPGTFVGEAVLKDNVRQLREALEDDAASPIYIETAHRRGYRFIGNLDERIAKEVPHSSPASTVSEFPPKASEPLTAPFGILGREAELGKLRGWLDQALAGERQAVFVTGEPGIGKTTVVQAFLEQARQNSGILIARGQCLEHYGSGEAYLPILDGFTRLCRSPNGPHLLNVLREHAPTWLAQMSSLIPPSEREKLHSQTAGASRERMLREMSEAIEALTFDSPLLLFIEDLHWSDYSTLDLVSYLARRRDPARFMLIGTYRPVDVILSNHPLKGVKRELQAHNFCHELPLEFLAEEAVVQYLAARFPGRHIPVRLRRTIYQCTEGNPLFMVDLVEYLVDRRMIVDDQGILNLRADFSEVKREVPANLKELIEKQIERLSPDERLVLEGASVAGMECSSAAIAAGLDKPTEWVEKQCEELARRHKFLSPAWLAQLPNGTVTPRHRFNHILYLEVPYSLIPPMRRALMHHRIAKCGVTAYGDHDNEIAVELAMHFEQSRDWSSALKYILRSAEIATNRSAHHEAADLAKRGFEILKSLPDTTERAQHEIKLRMILGVSLMAIKGFASAEVQEVYTQGRALFCQQGPSPELFHMLWSLNLYYQFRGEVLPSLDISRKLLRMAEGINDEALIMEGHRAVGAALVVHGRYAEGLEHLEKGSALYATNSNHRYSIFTGLDCKVICECFAARALWALGYPDIAAKRTNAALELARKLAHPQTLVVAGHFAAQLHQLRGEVSLTCERAREAVELADEYGMELWLAYGSIELAWAEAELGKTKTGIERIERAITSYESTGARLWSSYTMLLLADQLAKAGRVEEGLATIAKALTYAEQSGEKHSLPELYRMKGELLIKAGERLRTSRTPEDLGEARVWFARALAIAKEQHAKSYELRAHMSIARLDPGPRSAVYARLAENYFSFIEGGETADLQQAKALLDSVPSYGSGLRLTG